MSIGVRVSGAWKDVSAISVRVGGAWKTVDQAYVKVSGTWKELLDAVADISAPTVDVNAAAPDSGGGTTTNTFNAKTSTGPRTYLLVTANVDTVSGVTWNGVAGAQLVTGSNNGRNASIWYWNGAQSGNVVVTLGASGTAMITAVSIANVQSATPIDTDSEPSVGTGDVDLDSLTSPGVGGIRLACYMNRSAGTAVEWTNATEMSDAVATQHRHSTAYDLGDDATAIGATGASNETLIVGVSLR